MHPKEFKKTKNGTGHFTNLSLKNCEIHIGVDFSQNDTTLCVLELLTEHKHETLDRQNLDSFLLPFKKMVKYQLSCE